MNNPDKPFATNAEIDDLVLKVLGRNPDGLRSMALGASLRALNLKEAGTRNKGKEFWNACEHANRACQRLKKQGKIQFQNRVWTLVQPATS